MWLMSGKGQMAVVTSTVKARVDTDILDSFLRSFGDVQDILQDDNSSFQIY